VEFVLVARKRGCVVLDLKTNEDQRRNEAKRTDDLREIC